MIFIKDFIDNKHKFYLCFSEKNNKSEFSCHLYNAIEGVIYIGSDKIKSECVNVSNNFEYILIIPIKETVYQEIMNMYFIEASSLGINGILKKYNLEEYTI